MEPTIERIAIALDRIAMAIEVAVVQPPAPPPPTPPPPPGPCENPIPCMDRIRSRTPIRPTSKTAPPQPSLTQHQWRVLEEIAIPRGIQMPLGAMPLGIRVLPTRETADTRVLARSTTATTIHDADESDADAQPDAQPDP